MAAAPNQEHESLKGLLRKPAISCPVDTFDRVLVDVEAKFAEFEYLFSF